MKYKTPGIDEKTCEFLMIFLPKLRRISFLCVTYKLTSGVIAERGNVILKLLKTMMICVGSVCM